MSPVGAVHTLERLLDSVAFVTQQLQWQVTEYGFAAATAAAAAGGVDVMVPVLVLREGSIVRALLRKELWLVERLHLILDVCTLSEWVLFCSRRQELLLRWRCEWDSFCVAEGVLRATAQVGVESMLKVLDVKAGWIQEDESKLLLRNGERQRRVIPTVHNEEVGANRSSLDSCSRHHANDHLEYSIEGSGTADKAVRTEPQHAPERQHGAR